MFSPLWHMETWDLFWMDSNNPEQYALCLALAWFVWCCSFFIRSTDMMRYGDLTFGLYCFASYELFCNVLWLCGPIWSSSVYIASVMEGNVSVSSEKVSAGKMLLVWSLLPYFKIKGTWFFIPKGSLPMICVIIWTWTMACFLLTRDSFPTLYFLPDLLLPSMASWSWIDWAWTTWLNPSTRT